jgi:AraC family transcriptional regulator of adaptative response/methylated-DNA-[protein]-cysteine methyltransferase
MKDSVIFFTTHISTPLGTMIAVADSSVLRFLDFIDARHTQKRIQRLVDHSNTELVEQHTDLFVTLKQELDCYFKGTLKLFTTPTVSLGTPFQQNVWKMLRTIPCGITISYTDLAKMVGKPTAFRAVAQANGANQFPLIIPCHRVINADGKLGGYSSGLERKVWLLEHEKQIK